MKKSGGLQWLIGALLFLSVPAWGQNISRQGDASNSEQARPAAKTGVINESQLLGLPMNGRSYTQLATLDAGVSGDPFGGGKQGGNIRGIKVSGGRWEWNSFLLDGTDINDITNQVPRSAAGGQLGADTLLQVQVFSTNYGAQYGRAAGGVLNAITRSGSNDWHGTVFEFLRNSKLDAPNFFDPKSEQPPFKRNQFGATLMGPVAKDHTFFMVGFEALRNRLTETAVSFVPDNEARLRAEPRVAPYVGFYPSAQTLVLKEGKPTGVAENRMGVAQPSNEYFFTVRVDQRLGDGDAWFARYTFDDANTAGMGASPSFPVRSKSRQQYLTLAETHFFSPAFVNTVRLSYTRPVSRSFSAPTVEIPSSLYFVRGSPQFGVIDVPGLVPLGATATFPSAKVMNTYQAADDFIYSRGEHTWKWGMLAERFQWNAFDSTNMGGQWSFNSLENFLKAGPQGTELRVALPRSDSYRAFRQTLFGFYLQDDYRLRPNLSLGLGLRYELTTMIHDALGRDVYLRDELRDVEPQVGRFMSRNPSLRSLAPRIGLSWSPWNNSKKLVVRAGFGIYYDHIIGYSADLKRVTMPFFKLAIRSDFDSSKDFPDALAAARAAEVNNQVRIFEYKNPKTPTVYRYHLTLERELLPGLTAEASYVGSRGNNLLRTFEANLFPFPEQQPDGSLYFPAQCNKLPENLRLTTPCRTYAGPMNPAFSSIERTTTDSQSFYNAFLLSINRSLWHGLSSGLNYTFTKSVNEASGVSAVERHYALQRTLSRGLDSGEVRHRLSLNYFYSLPWGSGGGWLGSGWRANVFGGWRVGGILSVRTGLPEEPFFRIAYPGFTFVSLRPSLAPGRSNNPTQGVSSGCKDPTGQTVIEAGRKLEGPDLYFDPCAFLAPPPGKIGNAGRNIIVGPRVVNLDLSVQKNFAIDSQRSLQFRAEFFNIPNHPNFNPPERAGGGALFKDAKGNRNPNAGRLTSTATASRQIQFALRLSF